MSAVVADGLDRTVLECFVALGLFFGILRLLEADVVIFIVAHSEVTRCSVGANLAENTLSVDIKLSWDIVFPFIFFKCHY